MRSCARADAPGGVAPALAARVADLSGSVGSVARGHQGCIAMGSQGRRYHCAARFPPSRPPTCRPVGAENRVTASDQRLRGRPTSGSRGNPGSMIVRYGHRCRSATHSLTTRMLTKGAQPCGARGCAGMSRTPCWTVRGREEDDVSGVSPEDLAETDLTRELEHLHRTRHARLNYAALTDLPPSSTGPQHRPLQHRARAPCRATPTGSTPPWSDAGSSWCSTRSTSPGSPSGCAASRSAPPSAPHRPRTRDRAGRTRRKTPTARTDHSINAQPRTALHHVPEGRPAAPARSTRRPHPRIPVA